MDALLIDRVWDVFQSSNLREKSIIKGFFFLFTFGIHEVNFHCFDFYFFTLKTTIAGLFIGNLFCLCSQLSQYSFIIWMGNNALNKWIELEHEEFPFKQTI